MGTTKNTNNVNKHGCKFDESIANIKINKVSITIKISHLKLNIKYYMPIRFVSNKIS